ncbi:MAG: hypothetical protein ABRQ25_03700 [Clostridiaceae bacterium]
MNKLWILTKFFIRSFYYGITSNAKGKAQQIAVAAAILISMGSIAIPISFMVSAIYKPLVLLNQKELLLGTLFNTASLVIFILGITGVMSIFYFSQDVEWLLPLPVKASHIVIGKFLSIVLYEYIFLICIIPGVIVYGIVSGSGLLYYLSAIIVLLSLPVVPIAYGTIISFLLMRFTNLSKHKDGFKVIAGFMGIFFALGINFLIQRMGNNFHVDNAESIQAVLGQGSIFDRMTTIFFNVKFSTYCLTESGTAKGFINLILLILITSSIVVLVYKLADTLYIRGAVGLSQSSSRKSILSGKQKESFVKENSQLTALIKREIKILLRTPSYVINCISTLILPIIIFIIPFIGSGAEGIRKLNELVSGSKDSPHIIIGIYIGLMAFMVSSNSIASTAVSREGKEMAATKYMPVLPKTRLLAKVYMAVGLSNVTNIIFALALLMFKVNIETIIGAFLMGELIIVLVSILGVLIDTYSPKLDWDNEQQAVKNNFNIMKTIGGMLILSVISLLLYIGGTFVISQTFGFATVIALLIACTIVSYRILINKSTARLEKIE